MTAEKNSIDKISSVSNDLEEGDLSVKKYCLAEKKKNAWAHKSSFHHGRYIGWHKNDGHAHFFLPLALILAILFFHAVIIWGLKLHVAEELLTFWVLCFVPALKKLVKISSKEWQLDWEMHWGGVISAAKIFPGTEDGNLMAKDFYSWRRGFKV